MNLMSTDMVHRRKNKWECKYIVLDSTKSDRPSCLANYKSSVAQFLHYEGHFCVVKVATTKQSPKLYRVV